MFCPGFLQGQRAGDARKEWVGLFGLKHPGSWGWERDFGPEVRGDVIPPRLIFSCLVQMPQQAFCGIVLGDSQAQL